MLTYLARWRLRAVWSDPTRTLRTLESFARTEEDGGRDIEAASRRVADPDLRGHLLRHAEDERRHAALFRERAAALRSEHALGGRPADEADQAYDLSRGRRGHEVDAHGFFRAGLCDELGERAYVAMLHVAEQRAAALFETHFELNQHAPELAAVFDSILKDEKYHVAYTGKFLDRWRAAGHEREVEAGIARAKGSRFMGAWKRLGVRSAAGFSQAVLFILYWTLLLPFGVAARRSRGRSSAPARAPATAPAAGASLADRTLAELARQG